jgi:hypothetical protein
MWAATLAAQFAETRDAAPPLAIAFGYLCTRAEKDYLHEFYGVAAGN